MSLLAPQIPCCTLIVCVTIIIHKLIDGRQKKKMYELKSKQANNIKNGGNNQWKKYYQYY